MTTHLLPACFATVSIEKGVYSLRASFFSGLYLSDLCLCVRLALHTFEFGLQFCILASQPLKFALAGNASPLNYISNTGVRTSSSLLSISMTCVALRAGALNFSF